MSFIGNHYDVLEEMKSCIFDFYNSLSIELEALRPKLDDCYCPLSETLMGITWRSYFIWCSFFVDDATIICCDSDGKQKVNAWTIDVFLLGLRHFWVKSRVNLAESSIGLVEQVDNNKLHKCLLAFWIALWFFSNLLVLPLGVRFWEESHSRSHYGRVWESLSGWKFEYLLIGGIIYSHQKCTSECFHFL